VAAFRQHLGFAAGCGALYGAALHLGAGLHWLYAGTAALLTTVGGLLPDLDAPAAVQMRGFTRLVGVLAAVAVTEDLHLHMPGLPVEVHLWAVLAAFALARWLVSSGFSRVMVHRGMMHSLPAAAIFGELTYLVYPTPLHPLRLVMAAGVFLGAMSHLLLDEIYSVDLAGGRLKSSSGTAMKFWSGSWRGTLATYAILAYLTWLIYEHPPVPPVPWEAPPAPLPPIRLPSGQTI
jgi:hypothetical protein